MAYRNGTYVAFDGLGQIDPTQSDFKYYSTIQAWAANSNIDFTFVNSHEKTNAVRDTSLQSTLKSRINERLSNSKNAIIILSSETRKSGSMLIYEIEQAADYYKIPLIIVYTGYEKVQDVGALSHLWPYALTQRINDNSAKAIHVPFKKSPILDAISQFSINDTIPNSSREYYSTTAYSSWGIQ